MEFTVFSKTDFEAYLENKWTSNVFNRERLDVKQKLLALGRQLQPTLVAADGSMLECETSAEHPAIWNQHAVANQYLFFSRNKDARRELEGILSQKRSIAAQIGDPSPLRHYTFLSVMIDRLQIELALKVHYDAAIDRDNLVRKCQDFFQREKFINLLRRLPNEFKLGLEGQTLSEDSSVDDALIQQLLTEFAQSSTWLTISQAISREDPILASAEQFVELVRERLQTLLPLMHFISWSRDNDYVSMRDTLKKKEVQVKTKGLAKNDQVKVIRGMLAGKTGIVQAVDKNTIKVLVGKMLVKLTTDDVSPL